MNEYMFYTLEGFTQSPNKTDCENLQILGFEKAENLEAAKEHLLVNNDWIFKYGFDAEKILSKKILTEESLASIKTVVDYLWEDEEKDYEECFASDGNIDNHIFKHLRKLKLLTEENRKTSEFYSIEDKISFLFKKYNSDNKDPRIILKSVLLDIGLEEEKSSLISIEAGGSQCKVTSEYLKNIFIPENIFEEVLAAIRYFYYEFE
ncbi:hypothetical protein [uncultured Treponema sp.]|uniref:hypothetical protein n=1 Tax=uncultured Treponema sp. TaxID=162155 RepID=UPI0025D8CBF9|nr:hypothetical protein [uncultured Treponema sp.]